MSSALILARLIARHADTLATHLPAALEGESHGVHQARVASRRLRELLPIVAPAKEARPYRRLRRRLRRLTRALGPLREADVTLAGAERVGAAADAPARVPAELARVLGAERDTHRASLGRRFDPGRVERLLARLTRLSAALEHGAGPAGWRDLLARRIERRARTLHAAVADAGALFDSERLHRVRIAVKQLRYALEVASDSRAASAGALVRTLKDAQDALGHLHDDDVLLRAVRALVPARAARSTGSRDVELEEGIAWFDRELTAETRRLHARYLRRQATLIRVADTALDSIVPRVLAPATPDPLRARRPRRGADA